MKTVEERLKDVEDVLDEVGKSLPKGLPKQQFSEQKPTDNQLLVWDAAKGMYVPQGMAGISGTANTVFYVNSSGVIVELALGAAGTALVSNGASSAPSFDTVTSAWLHLGI